MKIGVHFSRGSEVGRADADAAAGGVTVPLQLIKCFCVIPYVPHVEEFFLAWPLNSHFLSSQTMFDPYIKYTNIIQISS